MRKMNDSIRWAFKFSSWNPSKMQWMSGSQCIQAEEKERIGKFVFKKDGKSSLSGRLLLRKVITETLHIPWSDIKLARTDKGKPYLTNDGPGVAEFNLNVSHQGDFAVLASEKDFKVGIDVMKIEETAGSKSVEEFFRLMARQFTDQEWAHIQRKSSEKEQLAAFYRCWTLKESYVKALGVGIGINLQTIDFHLHSDLSLETYTNDTEVHIEGQLQPQWRFEETMLDEKHCVATALCQKQKSWPARPTEFKFLTFDELLSGAQPLTDADEEYWLRFSKKSEKPGKR